MSTFVFFYPYGNFQITCLGHFWVKFDILPLLYVNQMPILISRILAAIFGFGSNMYYCMNTTILKHIEHQKIIFSQLERDTLSLFKLSFWEQTKFVRSWQLKMWQKGTAILTVSKKGPINESSQKTICSQSSWKMAFESFLGRFSLIIWP